MTGYDHIRAMTNEQLEAFLELVAKFCFLQGASAMPHDDYDVKDNVWPGIYEQGCYYSPLILTVLDKQTSAVAIAGYEDELEFTLPRRFVDVYTEEVPKLVSKNGMGYPALSVKSNQPSEFRKQVREEREEFEASSSFEKRVEHTI